MSSYYPVISSDSLQNDQDMYFDIADYFEFVGHSPPPLSRPPPLPLPLEGGDTDVNCSKQVLESSSFKVAFKTKSDVEVLEDGYKWRKYGKKAVKNSPNPRNYYRCSSEGCNVKKRIERAQEDSHYVITTYEGVHNHHAPLPATSYENREPGIQKS